VEVHQFKSVERGSYRVATQQDMQEEARRLLGANDVVISGTPADKVFSEKGIDVRPAVVSH
jgi:hypothetical protein